MSIQYNTIGGFFHFHLVFSNYDVVGTEICKLGAKFSKTCTTTKNEKFKFNLSDVSELVPKIYSGGPKQLIIESGDSDTFFDNNVHEEKGLFIVLFEDVFEPIKRSGTYRRTRKNKLNFFVESGVDKPLFKLRCNKKRKFLSITTFIYDIADILRKKIKQHLAPKNNVVPGQLIFIAFGSDEEEAIFRDNFGFGYNEPDSFVCSEFVFPTK